MRLCGIISEYNPFHLGHEEHIRLTRIKTGADIIICVMSGNFVQRGEPAVFDKWARTECALKCGADAVIELPLLFAIQSAEGFAAGGVSLLNKIGAQTISFGCETDDIIILESIADKLCSETEGFKKSLKTHLSKGISYPHARMKAAFPDAPSETSMPNSILGVEYIKAIKKKGFKIQPYAIKRVGQGYHSDNIEKPLPSATAIRKAFADGKPDFAFSAMPDVCSAYLKSLISSGLVPVSPECFDRELFFIIRRGGAEYLKSLHDVSEGLENRIYEASKLCGTREELITKVKTKRYTYTRISRILLYALLGITKGMISERNRNDIDHIRILGVKNADVLSELSRKSSVPIITGSVASSPYPSFDVHMSDVYALTQNKEPFRSTARDFTEGLIIENP